MDFGSIFGLLAICSTMTGLITEALKKMGDVKEPNLLAGCVSVVVGLIVGVGYILVSELPFTLIAFCNIFVLVLFSWLCAMLGYDKVIQTIGQIKGSKEQ